MDPIEKALTGHLARAVYEGREENGGKIPDEHVSKVLDTVKELDPSRVEAIVVMVVLNTGVEPFQMVDGRHYVELDTEFGVVASAATVEAMNRIVMYGMNKEAAIAKGDTCNCELCNLRRALLADPSLAEQLLSDGGEVIDLTEVKKH